MAFVKEFSAFFEKNIDLDREIGSIFYVGGRKNILKKCTFLYIFAQEAHTFAHFSSIYAHFYPIFLAHFTKALQTNLSSHVFSRKTTISPKITPKFSTKIRQIKV